MRRWFGGAFALALVLAACGPPGTEVIELGPFDGEGLAATDLERVAVGAEAPDFALESYHGDTIRLSDYRGEKNVVLVFYRGHW